MALKNVLRNLRKNRKLSQKELARALHVGQSTVSHWESGRQEPNTAERKNIARFYGISEADLFSDGISSSVAGVKGLISRIPLISWVHANEFSPLSDPFPAGIADMYIESTVVGKHIFALKVINDCMEPEFRDGDIIIINPRVDIHNNDYVVIRDTRSQSATFKQYKKYGKKIILHPLNPKYSDIELDHNERYEIVGKVVAKEKKY